MQTSTVRHIYTTGAAGNRLHYLDFGGTGMPLICMHGVIGNAWNWATVAEGLTDRRRVLALDYRGYGESQWSASGDYTTESHAEDLGAVIDSIGGGRVDLMGSSWGALVAIQYATDHPENVGQIVVVDVEASFEQAETDLFPMPRSHADDDEVRSAVAGSFPNASPEMVDLTAATSYKPIGEGLLAAKHDPYFFERWPFRSNDQWSNLEGLSAPTLYVHASDSFVRSEVMADMASRTPSGDYAEVSPSTHVIPVDNPAGLVEVVKPFLAT